MWCRLSSTTLCKDPCPQAPLCPSLLGSIHAGVPAVSHWPHCRWVPRGAQRLLRWMHQDPLTSALASLASRQPGSGVCGASPGPAVLWFPEESSVQGKAHSSIVTYPERIKRGWGRARRWQEVLWKLLGSCRVPGCAISQGSCLECGALGQRHQVRPGARERRNALSLERVTDTCAGWYQRQEVEPSRTAALRVTQCNERCIWPCVERWSVTLEKEGTKGVLRLEKAGNFRVRHFSR